MSESEWGADDLTSPPKKRGIPKWVWIGCGGGCLLFVLATAALTFVSYRFVDNAMDEDVQWPRLQKVLHYDERPENISLEGGFNLGFSTFILRQKSGGIYGTLYEYPAGQRVQFENLFDHDPPSLAGLGAPVNPEDTDLDLQGRNVRSLRYDRIGGEPKSGGAGPGIRIDLTGEGERPRLIDLRSLGDDPVSDEDIAQFLEPFDLWHDDR